MLHMDQLSIAIIGEDELRLVLSAPPLEHSLCLSEGSFLFERNRSLSHSSPCTRLSASRHAASSSGGILFET